jgi:predicted oxidoreductase (fatty acid repression mutant protein)
MQSTRMLITLGAEHKNFWNTVITSAKPFVLEDQGEGAWEHNGTRFRSFPSSLRDRTSSRLVFFSSSSSSSGTQSSRV